MKLKTHEPLSEKVNSVVIEGDDSIKELISKAEKLTKKPPAAALFTDLKKGYWMRCCGVSKWIEDANGFDPHPFDHDETDEFMDHLVKGDK